MACWVFMVTAHRYELLAIDVDGTLLDSNFELRPRSRSAVRQAAAHGTQVVIATARAVPTVSQLVAQLDLGPALHIISSSGRAIHDGLLQPVRLTSLPPDLIAAARDFSTRHGLEFLVVRHDGSYVSEADSTITQEYAAVFSDDSHEVLPFAEWDLQNVTKFMIRVGPGQTDTYLDAAASELLEYEATRVWKNIIEVHPRGDGKERALAVIADDLNIHPSAVIAIGDDLVDIGMIRYAGLGVAMGNASPAVKAAADLVTGTNDEDGVAAVIERYLLNSV